MDIETRILLTGGGKYVEDVVVWLTDSEGQWAFVDSIQVDPFATRQELAIRIARLLVRTWADDVAIRGETV